MEIGGSCIYLQIAGKRILLDCGIRQSGTKDPLPDFAAIQAHGGLDAVVISHAHMDHIGTLPIISKAYPNVQIYMTVMTDDLTRVLLYDSLKIMDHRENEIPHYTEQDVIAMLGRIRPVRFQTPLEILEGVSLTFYPAGHIAGAACVYLTTEEGTLFYSGDFSTFSQRTIEGIHIPKLRPDVVIVETTYGNRLHSNRQVEEKRLISLVSECIRSGQKILIPAFALGRAQEVLLILRAGIQNGEIPSVPVYVDGMVRDINTMYTRNPTFLKNSLARRIIKGNEPFYTKEIQAVPLRQDRNALLSGKDPMIIVSSSGMLTGGPSAQYAQHLVSSENACIIITGYQDEESPGRQLLNLLEDPSEGKLTIDGVSYPVRCRIEQVGLSAHGDKLEINALLERLSSRHIFLVHGNADVIAELGGELASEDYRRHVYLPECGQEYEITLRNKRKQLTFVPAFTMQKSEHLTRENEKQLWMYWRSHYPDRRFPVSIIARIWYGRQITDEDILQEMQEALLHSPYFSPNLRQLFLFEANTEEEVSQALKPKELTIQDLQAHIESAFSGYNYRKISYHQSTRQVLLLFDYPDSLDQEDFQKRAEKFREETGWTAEVNPSMNYTAAGSLLHTLFPGRLTKASYYPDRKCYAVTLPSRSETDPKAASEFCRTTGWTLSINGEMYDKNGLYTPDHSGAESAGIVNGQGLAGAGIVPNLVGTGNSQAPSSPADSGKVSDHAGQMEFIPSPGSFQASDPLEQNLALSCIDQEFSLLPCVPEKKSLKQDSSGRYMELSFISPEVGCRFGDAIQRAADQTGWRIRIADKVNQNGLMQTALSLCAAYGITLGRNPSYLPQKRALMLKVSCDTDPEVMEKLKKEFYEKTGCECETTAG